MDPSTAAHTSVCDAAFTVNVCIPIVPTRNDDKGVDRDAFHTRKKPEQYKTFKLNNNDCGTNIDGLTDSWDGLTGFRIRSNEIASGPI